MISLYYNTGIEILCMILATDNAAIANARYIDSF